MKDGRGNTAHSQPRQRSNRPLAAVGSPAMQPSRHHASAPAPRQAHTLRRSALLVIVGVWLALVIAVLAQAHGSALAGSAPPNLIARGTRTGTPGGNPTPTIGATATPQITVTDTPSATVTGTPTDTPTDTPTVYVNSGPAAPQPTKLVLSQPTVGSGGGGLGGGIGGLGDSSMFIAVILGCVTSALGIVIGAVALLALIRTGYGPFLRALLLGKRARPATATSGKAADVRNRAGSASRAGAAGGQSRRVGDGTLNYQETGDVGGGLWRDADARQSGRMQSAPRDPRDPRRARDDDYAGYPSKGGGAPRESRRGREERQPPRSEPRSRSGAGRPPSRPASGRRDEW